MSSIETPDAMLRRRETGVPGLDRILGGWRVEAGMCLIEGAFRRKRDRLSSAT